MADLYYIESGYFDPELGYYVYTADAESSQTVTASLTAIVGVIKEASSTQLVEASITATISNVKGVDIVLTPFASVSADVNVIRDAESTQSSIATQTTASDRLRDFNIALSDAFAFTATATGGGVQNAEASISSAFAQTTVGNLVADSASTQTSAFAQTTVGNLVADATSNQTVSVTQTASGGIIYEQVSSISGAFSATMSVNVQVNPLADFNFVAEMTTDFVVNRSAAITLETIGNLNAQAARSAGLASTIDSLFTQTTQANRVTDAASTQTTTAALTASISKIQDASATITASASLSVSAIIPTLVSASLSSISTLTAIPTTYVVLDSPHVFRGVGSPVINTSVKKFGAASLYLNGSSYLTHTYNNSDLSLSGDFYIEAFFYPTSLSGSVIAIGETNSEPIFDIKLENIFFEGIGSRDVVSLYYTDGGIIKNLVSTNALRAPNLNQWNHVAVARSGTSLRMWINGVSDGLLRDTSNSDTFQGSRYTIGRRPRTTGGTFFLGYIDAVEIGKGSSKYDTSSASITVPTAEKTLSDAYTSVILNFNENYLDQGDATVEIASASLSSAVTVSAQANKAIVSSANLAANGFVVTVAGYRLDDLADLTTAFSQTADVNITADAASSQSSAFTQTAVGGFLTTANSDLFVSCSLSIDGNLVAGITETYTSTASQTASADRLRGFNANLQAEGFQVTVAGEQQDVTADLSSVVTLTAVLGIIKQAASAQTSAFTLSANAGLSADSEASMASAFAQTAIGDRIRFADSTQTSAFTQTTVGNFVADAFSSQLIESTLSGSAVRTRDHTANFIEFLTVNAQANYLADNNSQTSSTTAQTTLGNYIASAEINGSAVGFVIAVTAYTSTINSDMHSAFTMDVTANYILDESSNQSSSFALSAVNDKIVEFSTVETVLAVTNNSANQTPTGPFLKLTQSEATASVGCFYISAYMKDAIGYIFDSYPNKPDEYIQPNGEASGSRIQIETNAGIPSFYYYGENGYVVWQLSDQDIRQSLIGFHHYFLRVNTQESTNQLKYRLFLDGVEVPQTLVSGTNILFRVAGTYNLMMNTGFTNTTNHWTAFNSSGFGDIGTGWGPAAVGQFIFDYKTSYNSTTFPVSIVDKLFPYADLGLDGTGTGLDQPIQYVALEDYTDVSNRGTLGGNYAWKQLSLAQAPYRYTLGDFSATTSNNSTGYTNNIIAISNLTAIGQSIQVISANVTAQSSIQISAVKTAIFNTALTSSAAISVLTKVNKTFVIPLSSDSNLTANAGSTQSISANLNSTATLTADADITSGAIANLTSEFTIVAATGFLGSAQANLTSTATLSVNADKIKDVFITVGSSADVTASAIYTASANFNQTAVFALHATADKIRGTASDILSDFGLTANTVVLRTANANLTSAFSQTANVGQIKGTSANLLVAGFVLTAGKVIHIDPSLTYTIDSESRIYKIRRETRVYSIPEETRIYKLRGY